MPDSVWQRMQKSPLVPLIIRLMRSDIALKTGLSWA